MSDFPRTAAKFISPSVQMIEESRECYGAWFFHTTNLESLAAANLQQALYLYSSYLGNNSRVSTPQKHERFSIKVLVTPEPG